MKIYKAQKCSIETVKFIAHDTINSVFPHYYPHGAVEFFLHHHREENILRDIEAGDVFLINDGNADVGTVTVNGNEIKRLFVFLEFQGKGYGKCLMEFAEKLVAEKYDCAELSASLSAKKIYLKNGYIETEYHIIDCENGDKLCFDYMKKKF